MEPEDFGNLYELKIYKAWGGRSNEGNWVNTYHFASSLGIAAGGWVPIIEAFAAFEKGFHLQPVNFMRGVISTMQEDAPNYPNNLKVYEFAGTGTKGIGLGQSAIDLNFALQIQKQLETGRSGRMLYRGVLRDDMMMMGPGGKQTLKPEAPVTGDITPLWQALQGVLTANVASTRWVVPTKTPQEEGGTFTVRNVLGVKVSGVVLNKRNHKYFDKGGPAGGGDAGGGDAGGGAEI